MSKLREFLEKVQTVSDVVKKTPQISAAQITPALDTLRLMVEKVLDLSCGAPQCPERTCQVITEMESLIDDDRHEQGKGISDRAEARGTGSRA